MVQKPKNISLKRKSSRKSSRKSMGGVGSNEKKSNETYNMQSAIDALDDIAMEILEDAKEEQLEIDRKIKEINDEPIPVRSSKRTLVVKKRNMKLENLKNLLLKRQEQNEKYIKNAESRGLRPPTISRKARGKKLTGISKKKSKTQKKPPSKNIGIDELSNIFNRI